MPKFRKKPVVIEAYQLPPKGTPREVPPRLAAAVIDQRVRVYDNRAHIDTLEGTMTAEVGDWIIRGVNGELYPCKPGIFAKTYDQVDEDGELPHGHPDAPLAERDVDAAFESVTTEERTRW